MLLISSCLCCLLLVLSTENICGRDSADLSSTTESRQRDVKLQKVNMKSTSGRIPLSVRKACQNDDGHHHHLKTDDWHVEIAVPRTHSVAEFHNEESESSSVTKPLETMSADVTSMQEVCYEYVPMDDKQECSSVSNLATDNYETKFLTAHDCFINNNNNNGLQKPIARSQQFGEEISCIDEQMYSMKMKMKMQHRRSSDSTVTEPSPQTTHECCAQMATEMICIQNQLSDIEIKQANMMHQLQVLMLYTHTAYIYIYTYTYTGMILGFLFFLYSMIILEVLSVNIVGFV